MFQMGKDEIKLGDVEEGEISDSASIEEISEKDFNKQEVMIVQETKSTSKVPPEPNSNSRVWTMQDLRKYPSVFRRYTSGLYNFAWAQAVQNKPLNVKEIEQQPQQQQDDNNNNKRSSPLSIGNSADIVVIDDSGDDMDEDKVLNMDKEEGELEEGEIDLDLDSELVKERVSGSEDRNVGNSNELEKRVNLIRGVLEEITVIEAEKSFEGVCSKLQNALESLKGLVFEHSFPTKDILIELAFGAVNSAFVALNGNLKEQNVSILSRLLSVVKGFNPPLFPPDKMKEIEVMLLSLNSPAREIDLEKEIIKIVNNKDHDALAENNSHDLAITNKLPLPVESDSYKQNMLTETLKLGGPNFRNKGLSLPLLDLHKDHDEDSLPSPTRETTPCLPVHRPLTIGDGMVKPGFMTGKGLHGAEGNKLHPYETDALKAFSSYQQKFGRGSFVSSDLPSPTPSEDSGDEGGDYGGEVSSSSSIGNFKPTLPVLGLPIVSPPPQINSASSTSSMQGQFTTQNATVVTVSSASNIMSKASAKSRDPRLRFANSNASALDLNQRSLHNATKVSPVGGIMDPRKKKSAEEPVLDGPALKRQKNELENLGVVRNVRTTSRNGGWLEDTDNSGSQITNRNQTVENLDSTSRKMEYELTSSSTLSGKNNMTVNKNEQVQMTGISAPSLPALLKDIAVNPTMLINILKMGQQQRLASETQQKSSDPRLSKLHQPSSSPILGVVPPANAIPSPSVNTVPSSSSGTLLKPAGNLQVPSPDESGKIRMKPRDPRRVLHGNMLQKSSGVRPDQLKLNGISPISITQGSKDNMNVRKQLENQTESKPIHSQLVPPPDIAQQFTQSLKNIAGMMSVSQPITSPPVVSQNLVSQPIQVKSDGTDMSTIVSSSEDQQTGTGATPEVGVARPPSQNTWGDVEHLFERYDDRQKAAIQRERARRLEEQNKMFAARKLSLVLDLDHTLLNSAKFVEIDPVHEEILRKKEEQDREKLRRHLFCFNKMQMWTKLRPGVWNFLEKASKLFEMHLYTMGNKLYATEMAKLLDPKGVLFAGRVISRGDDGDPLDGDEKVPRTKDLEGVMGMESSVVIVDDSVRVWPRNKPNLIVVERYTYFPCSRRQFGLLGPSLLEIDHDERPEDGTLASSLGVIERIHQNFFSHQKLDDVDVRNILSTEQRKILSGCRIVFSRVFPVGQASPHLHPLWQTAEQFGASCTNQIDEHVTHVVANSLGTDKVNWAISTGKFVVHPGWVEASALLYRRASELDFAIKP